jgi:hypothetical protein
MSEITTWVLIIAAYPFIAAWLVGLRRGYQINELEEQLVFLREKVKQLSPAPLETPAPRPADMAVSTVPKDDVEQVSPAVLPDSAHAQVQGMDAASASVSAVRMPMTPRQSIGRPKQNEVPPAAVAAVAARFNAKRSRRRWILMLQPKRYLRHLAGWLRSKPG